MLNLVLPSKPARAIVLAFVLGLSWLPAFAQATAPAPALQAPPVQWPRSHDYDVQHYRLVVRFDWSKKSVAGETTITLRPFKSDLKELEIDAGEMTINSVKLAQGTPLQFRYEGNEKLFVTLDRADPAGQDMAITINYTAVPKKGLTFITPTETEPDRPYQIWSAGESQTNHYWFPCYDYPNDKATSELIATVESKYQVISNGALVSVTSNSAWQTWHWKMEQPFSSYLISIVVGQYAEVKDHYKNTPVISYVYPDQVENGRLSFAKLGQMVGFFSEKIGYDYPYAKYAQITVRDFPGALENISATTMTDTSVHDRRAHLDVSTDGVVSHELAHQWFGDLLTCRDWGEIWLNESFATFFSSVWAEHDVGKEEYLYDMLGNQQQYLRAWSRGNRRPIVVKRYDDPDDLFDTYAYPAGAAVLNMLRFVLGDELFWKAIHHYVEKYAWQNVETPQLVIAIEEATGQNLQWFFDEWVYKMGHPEFEITSKYDDSAKMLRLTVKQTQKPDDKQSWFQSPDFFTTPVDIAITTTSGERVHRVWIDKPEKDLTFPLESKPLIINFDRGNYIIKEMKFDRSDDELAYQLLHDSDVMGRVRAAIDLKTNRSEAAAKALAEAAQRDSFWAVRSEAVKSLSEFKTEAAHVALLEAMKDKDSRIRRAAVQGLGDLKDPTLAELFINIINTDPSYYVVADAARALGQSGAPPAYAVLVGLLKQDSWRDVIRGGALDGLAEIKDSRTLDIALKYAAPGHSVNVRRAAFQLLGEVGKGNDQALETLIAALKEGVENKSLQIGFGAAQALGTLGDARAIPVLQETAKGSDLPPFAKHALTSVINRIKSASEPGDEKKD